jgi:hypothetical protein
MGTVRTIPAFVTHYYVPGRPPFLNLSDLPDDSLTPVLEVLSGEQKDGTSHRVFGRRYMELRRRTEERLRERFVAAGGVPARAAPHYFVLGRSEWYRGLSTGMEEAVLMLGDLPDDATSFTYPDSLTSMGLGLDYGLPHEPKPYHGTVFRLRELAAVVGRHGLPADQAGDYAGYQHQPFEKYIEVQLWTDEPLARVRTSGDHR